MHVFHKKATLETLSKYSKGEKISHDVMRVVAADILEMYSQLSDELKVMEQDFDELFYEKNKEQIREKFQKNPDQAFAVAINLAQEASGKENPGKWMQLIGEVAKEFDVEISDCNWT